MDVCIQVRSFGLCFEAFLIDRTYSIACNQTNFSAWCEGAGLVVSPTTLPANEKFMDKVKKLKILPDALRTCKANDTVSRIIVLFKLDDLNHVPQRFMLTGQTPIISIFMLSSALT
jgi:hypothetical protein